jgi:hypothetical protein
MNPWPLRAVGRLESPNLLVTLQCRSHLIEPLKQPCPPAWIYLEAVSRS